MKKLIVLPIFIVLSSLFYGQITITSADFAPAGSIFTQITDTCNYSIDVSATGHQTWDFSDLSTGNVDTFLLIQPNTAPRISDFPKCNYALKIIDHDSSIIYQYMKKQDSLLFLGMYLTNKNQDTAIQSNLPFRYLSSFPMTYAPSQTTINQYLEITSINFASNPNTIKKYTYTTDTVQIDAWGTLNLPDFQNINVLRLLSRKQRIDSIVSINPSGDSTFVSTSTSYKKEYIWFTNDNLIKFRVFQVDISPTDTSIQFINYASIATNLSSIKRTNIEIFPNPAKNTIQISNIPKECSSIDFINCEGKRIKHLNKNEINKPISVLDLEAGIYLIRFNNIKLSKKLLIE